MKKFLKTAIVTVLSGVIFVGIAYAYLDYGITKSVEDADQKNYSTPYSRVPQNCGVALTLPDNSAVLVYLDFDTGCIRLLDIEKFDVSCPEYYGYSADYNIQIDYELIEGIIDRVGGIELEIEGKKQRYTGVQVIDLVAYCRAKDMKRQIILQVFDKISKNCFSKDDMVYIIENTKSNLSFVDCVDWMNYIGDMSSRVNFIN